jgi:hypothetical protein
MTGESKYTGHEKMVAIGDRLSNVASSDNGEDREDENGEVTGQARRAKMTKTVQQCMDMCRQ